MAKQGTYQERFRFLQGVCNKLPARSRVLALSEEGWSRELMPPLHEDASTSCVAAPCGSRKPHTHATAFSTFSFFLLALPLPKLSLYLLIVLFQARLLPSTLPCHPRRKMNLKKKQKNKDGLRVRCGVRRSARARLGLLSAFVSMSLCWEKKRKNAFRNPGVFEGLEV